MNDVKPGAARPAAFFDLDSTLLAVNSGKLWVHRERRAGRLPPRLMLRAFVYLVLYHFGAVNMDRVMRDALATIVGLEEEELRRWTREWFFSEVAPHAAPGAWPTLEEHRAQGHQLVLLTSSSPYASECATELFKLDAWLSTVYEVVDGRFTGNFLPPLCFGDGKVAHAERFSAEHGIDLDTSYFYTDSLTDLPMLERVGHPRAVHPDPRLRREARRRGWPILDWKVAPSPSGATAG